MCDVLHVYTALCKRQKYSRDLSAAYVCVHERTSLSVYESVCPFICMFVFVSRCRTDKESCNRIERRRPNSVRPVDRNKDQTGRTNWVSHQHNTRKWDSSFYFCQPVLIRVNTFQPLEVTTVATPDCTCQLLASQFVFHLVIEADVLSGRLGSYSLSLSL